METVTIAASKTPSKKTIAPGQSHNGTIGVDEVDCYYFSTHDDNMVRFTTKEVGSFRFIVEIGYAECGFIKEIYGYFDGDTLELAPEPGVEYRICVRGDSHTGSYQITMTTLE